MLDQQRLLALFRYDAERGLLISLRTGEAAGCLNNRGRRVIGVDGKLYRAARLIWLIERGDWPAGLLDHKDTNPSNDRIDNLREATPTQNNANRKPTKLFKGATFHKRSGKWRAQIKFQGKTTEIGTYRTAAEAHAAYRLKAAEVFGEFARTT